LPEFPPVAIAEQMAPELEEPLELELLLDELPPPELLDELLLLDDELELLELDELELLDEELLLEVPPTVMLKLCMLCAPQLLVCVAVAVQELEMVTVCERAVPEVPQPLQLQEPPDTGCGPNSTELPATTLTLAVCCQVPAFTRRKGVIAVGVQAPLELEELLELELLLVEPPLLEEDELELLLEDELLELLDELELLDVPPSRKASMATVGRRVLASQAPLS
jgi:hypothetical protein